MDFGRGVVESLKDRTIFVTGSTGFLAKVFLEKVLRVQPCINKLYLLVRAPDQDSAAQRLQSEIIGKQLFKVLREKHGGAYQSFMTSKLCPVAGDIIHEDLGIKDTKLRESMLKEVNIVVNVAASTSFDERYEVALNINTLGAKHVMKFAKQCKKIELLLHVSTAYVAGEKEGLLLENKYSLGETLNGDTSLDIDKEIHLANEALKRLHFEGSTKEEEKIAMVELGMTRSKRFGWPNTYVFTKAMAEMLLGHLRGDLPIVIVRPTIITSIYKDPIPGWMEGTRTIDSIIIGYAKGKLTCFLGDMDLIMDAIPCDLVVNAMIVAMVAHSNQPDEHIYHVSSSVRNPVRYNTLLDIGARYFSENPRVGKDGRIIVTKKLVIFSTMARFRRYMTVRYKLPLEALGLVNAALCGLLSDKYNELSRKYKYVMHMVNLYEPYVFFKGCFDDLNLERLRLKASTDGGTEASGLLRFDPKVIDWDHYFHEVHIPGVLKYAYKSIMPENYQA